MSTTQHCEQFPLTPVWPCIPAPYHTCHYDSPDTCHCVRRAAWGSPYHVSAFCVLLLCLTQLVMWYACDIFVSLPTTAETHRSRNSSLLYCSPPRGRASVCVLGGGSPRELFIWYVSVWGILACVYCVGLFVHCSVTTHNLLMTFVPWVLYRWYWWCSGNFCQTLKGQSSDKAEDDRLLGAVRQSDCHPL